MGKMELAQFWARGAEFSTAMVKHRCGWFDAVIGTLRRCINGLDCLAVTKLDVWIN
jgi:adenylosuccinate synthase